MTSISVCKFVSLEIQGDSERVLSLSHTRAFGDRAVLLYTTATKNRRTQSYVSGRSSLRVTGYGRGYAARYRAFGESEAGRRWEVMSVGAGR